MNITLKADTVLVLLIICTLIGCVTYTGYLQNRVVDNIVTREPLPPPAPDTPFHSLPMFRVVSLKQLQAISRAGFAEKAPAKEIQNLCGLKSVEGYVVDRKNKDVLIFGKLDDTMPPLQLDDFIVAMRCAWKKYIIDNMFTSPGCSIDWSVEYINRLDDIEKRLNAETDPDNWNHYQKEYEKACAGSQEVRILGIPSNTHFASVLVKADYDMKRVINGADALDIPGVVDLYSLGSYQARQAMLAKKEYARPGGSLSRFWFKPDRYHFLVHRELVYLDQCEISLLTQEQHITQDGKIEDQGRADPYAQRAVDSFTTYYSYIALKRPVYRQLKELMRMYIVLEAMYNMGTHIESGLAFDYFLNSFQVPKTDVPSSLPGQSRYVLEAYKNETDEGIEHAAFVFPMCGGVVFDVFLERHHFSEDHGKKFTKILRSIKLQRPGTDEVFWDVVNG